MGDGDLNPGPSAPVCVCSAPQQLRKDEVACAVCRAKTQCEH